MKCGTDVHGTHRLNSNAWHFLSSATSRSKLKVSWHMPRWIDTQFDKFVPHMMIPVVASSTQILNVSNTLIYNQTAADFKTFPSVSVFVVYCLLTWIQPHRDACMAMKLVTSLHTRWLNHSLGMTCCVLPCNLWYSGTEVCCVNTQLFTEIHIVCKNDLQHNVQYLSWSDKPCMTLAYRPPPSPSLSLSA